MNYYLFIENYIHVEKNNNHALFYNTLNLEFLIISNSEILSIIDELINNHYCITLNAKNLKNKILLNFINSLKEKYFGDLIPVNKSLKKPILLPRTIYIRQFEVDEINIENINEDEKLRILSYLREISFVINSGVKDGSIYEKAFKQFNVNINNGDQSQLSLDQIAKCFPEINRSSTLNINVLGGNLFDYKDILLLIELFNKLSIRLRYFFRIEDFMHSDHKCLDECIKVISKINFNNSKLEIFVKFPHDKEYFGCILSFLKITNFRITYHFIVESEENIEKVMKVLEENKIENYCLHPFYNNLNFEFFKKFVFIEENNIINSKLTFPDIVRNLTLNPSTFGKLIVMSNGEIFSEINSPPIANIEKNSLSESIYFELKNGKNWLKSRNNIEPCNCCIYKSFCPPISCYESYLKKYDLCNV